MKKLIGLLIVLSAFQLSAQNNSALLQHYKAYYQQMKSQGDVQGVINALTHLNILEPKATTRDTLAGYYMNEGKYIQALNTIGIDKNENDSDMAVEIKAVSLQALNQPQKAIEFYEILYKKNPNVLIAYELADLKIQTNDLIGATTNITFGLANSKDDMVKAYYDSQPAYQVPLKAAFNYLRGLVKFRENSEANIDATIAIMDEVIKVAPNFRRAQITKEALLARKNTPEKPKE